MRAFFALLLAYLLALGSAQAQITNPPPGNQTITGTSPITATGTCTGTVVNCILGFASQALPGTTQTIHAAQWNVGNTYVVVAAGQIFTLDPSSGLSPNGGMTIQNPSGASFTVTPAAGDTINPETGGTAGASVTISAGLVLATTDGAGKIHIAPTAASTGGSIAIGSTPITGTCPTGNNIFNNSGVAGCQANGTGAGITFTDGTNNVSGATKLTVTGGTIGGATPNATLNIASGGGALTVTDGTHPVANTSQITFTGSATVSGTSPNATVNVSSSGGGGSLTKIGTAVAANSTCLSFGLAVSGCVNGSTTDLSTLGYNTFDLTCDSVKPGTAGAYFYLHVAEGSPTPSIKTANYGWQLSFQQIGAAGGAPQGLGGGSTASANVGIMPANGTATNATFSSNMVLNLSTTQIPRAVFFRSNTPGDPTIVASQYYLNGMGTYVGDQAAITAITLDAYSAANGTQETGAAGIVSGSCTLYGRAN